MIIETNSPQETKQAGYELAQSVKAGCVVTLLGELGVGKTVFTQGFAEGLGITETVCSPTFTICQEYDTGRLPLYHFDVYRIGDPMEMEEAGFDEYIFGDGVSLIEWANLIEEILPQKYTQILIEKDMARGFDYRRIHITEV